MWAASVVSYSDLDPPDGLLHDHGRINILRGCAFQSERDRNLVGSGMGIIAYAPTATE